MTVKATIAQSIPALLAGIALVLLAWLWNWASDGGLIRILGGLTEKDLQEQQWRDALHGPQGERGPQGEGGPRGDAVSVPVGAVVAFDLPEGCPKDKGWRHYSAGAGRFIVGVGRHTLNDRYGSPLESLEPDQTGGHRTHKLVEDELPEHSHTYQFSSGSLSPKHTDTTMSEFGAKDRIEKTGLVGKNIPHNNMPPFVALRYCIYEGTQ